MIKLSVFETYLSDLKKAYIPKLLFIYLTGTKVNLDKRLYKNIYLSKKGNHIYIHDEKFIAGEKYRFISKVHKRTTDYICTASNEKNAVLSIIDTLETISINNNATDYIAL